MVTVRIKENSKQAKAFIELIKTFEFVEFVEEFGKPIGSRNKVEKIYDKEFVAMVKKAKNSGKGKILDPKDVWGSIL